MDQLTKDYQWSSLLDAADASPSEILADAAPVLVPPISPLLSVKSSPTESSNSDSGSEDDSKKLVPNSMLLLTDSIVFLPFYRKGLENLADFICFYNDMSLEKHVQSIKGKQILVVSD